MMKKIVIAVVLMVSALYTVGCAPVHDEAWIRITAFRSAGASGSITVLDSDIDSEQTDFVDVALENFSSLAGSNAGGVGIFVYRVNVDYRFGGATLPPASYPVTAYLPGSDGEGSSTTSTLEDLPLAPATLKFWLLDPANFPADVSAGPFNVEAKVTVFARTDEGRELETSGGIGIHFKHVAPAEVPTVPAQ